MSWCTDQRQAWIAEMVEIFGFINREHIEKKFGVSTQQASADIQEFMRANPARIAYNVSAKRYEKQA